MHLFQKSPVLPERVRLGVGFIEEVTPEEGRAWCFRRAAQKDRRGAPSWASGRGGMMSPCTLPTPAYAGAAHVTSSHHGATPVLALSSLCVGPWAMLGTEHACPGLGSTGKPRGPTPSHRRLKWVARWPDSPELPVRPRQVKC